MKILICGGDARSVRLAGMLNDAGHEVSCFCLDRAELPHGCVHTSGISRADAVILPAPALENGQFLRAPLAAAPCTAEFILERVEKGTLIIGGMLTPAFIKAAGEHEVLTRDYMKDPFFTARNADISAEGAVSRLMELSEKALCDMKVLVIGWGRIGKILTKKLGALCREVHLMSANPMSRALAERMGCRSAAPDGSEEVLKSLDAVINTAPAQVLPDLHALRTGCLLLELASAPGWLNTAEAEALGLDCTVARGIPGKYAPESAASAVFDAVTKILKECLDDE